MLSSFNLLECDKAVFFGTKISAIVAKLLNKSEKTIELKIRELNKNLKTLKNFLK